MPRYLASLFVICLCGVFCLATFAEQNQTSKSEAEQLVSASRAAIIKSGVSPQYFDRHFKLHRVYSSPADRRVMWQYAVNEYELVITDSIGSGTVAGVPHFSHSVSTTLPRLPEIRSTIKRSRAERIMRSCIGPFNSVAVEFRAVNNSGTGLFLTAVAERRRKDDKERRERHEREEREREEREQGKTPSGTDFIEEESELKVPLILGAVNLQTGKCTKGRAVAGPPPVSLN
jgi:hypothetical protein